MILVDHFKVRVRVDHKVANTISLIGLGVWNVDSSDPFQRVGFALIESPIEPVRLNQLLLQFMLNLLPFQAGLFVNLLC